MDYKAAVLTCPTIHLNQHFHCGESFYFYLFLESVCGAKCESTVIGHGKLLMYDVSSSAGC